MSIDAKTGAQIITDAVAAAALTQEPAAQAAAGVAVGKEFCSIWPKAKPVLELASSILSLFPGGAVAGPVLSGLIRIGDQIYADQCRT